MKKLILFYILLNASLLAFSQAIHIFHDGEKTPDVVANGGIDSIYVAPKFLGSTVYQQIFVTKDGEKRYNVVDSVKFNFPHLVATVHTINLPADGGSFDIMASCIGSEIPYLIRQDGNPIPSFSYDGINRYMYGWNCGKDNDYDAWNRGKKDDYNAHTETWYIVSGEMRDSITMNYTGLPFANNVYSQVYFSNEENEFTLDTNLPDSKLIIRWEEYDNGKENFIAEGIDWYYNEEGKPVIHFSRNDSGSRRHVHIGLCVGPFDRTIEMCQLGKPFKHTSEEHMAALREFCDATDYENWGRNNWWSDAPLWEWEIQHVGTGNRFCGINNNTIMGGYEPTPYWHINDHIVNLNLAGVQQYIGVHGTLPESFVVFFDDVDDEKGVLDLSSFALYGKIPYNIRHHKNWAKFGRNFIQQIPWLGGGFDMEDINLRIDSVEVEDFINGTISNTYDMLKKNKITWVFFAAGTDGISEELVNKYLDYCEKGLGFIATLRGVPDDEKSRQEIVDQQRSGLPKSIIWTKDFDKADIGFMRSMSLLDREGNLLWHSENSMDGLWDPVCVAQVDSVLRIYLGEPTEHETYEPSKYESTDYSHDGEVLTLQKATIGKGIDLVFMGDMYVDTLLVDGGQYEKDMHEAMEYFFKIEPYTSLRNRFNVYAVKVVSPNGPKGSEHKFHFNNDLVFEYAQKVPNVDMDNVTVTVINNKKSNIFYSGETGMWESGASIAWIEEGGPSNNICHETGGHGFGKLLDEYVYSGYEENHTQDDANEDFRNWIKTAYHDKGWGMNVSATDNPEEVPWAHFLKDERYKDEVGIYQGAWMWPEELWRPSEHSVMYNSSEYLWFNAPSREAIYKRVMQLSEGDDWTYDYEKFVEFDAPIREAFKQAMAKVRNLESVRQETQKPHIERRSPTLYKGSWRDAGKCKKVTSGVKRSVVPNTISHKPVKSVMIDLGMEGGRYNRAFYIYPDEYGDTEEFNTKWFNSK